MEGDRGGGRLRVHPRSRRHHEDSGSREEVQRRDGLQRRMVAPSEAESAQRGEGGGGRRGGGTYGVVRPARGRGAGAACEEEEETVPKALLCYLDIGLNPNARSGFLQDAIVAGNVYVAVGANDEVPGGKNKTDFYLGGSLTGANVTIDGRPVIQHGNLAT